MARRHRAWVQAGTAALAAVLATIATLAVDSARRSERDARAMATLALRVQSAANAQADAEVKQANIAFSKQLATLHGKIGELELSLGHRAEAIKALESAEELLARNAEPNPDLSTVRNRLAIVRNGVAMALRDVGRHVEARAALEKNLRLLERRSELVSPEIYQIARAYAIRSSLDDNIGGQDHDARTAMASLRRAIAAGFCNSSELRADPALDRIRDRFDFRLLLMDMEFPAEVFQP